MSIKSELKQIMTRTKDVPSFFTSFYDDKNTVNHSIRAIATAKKNMQFYQKFNDNHLSKVQPKVQQMFEMSKISPRERCFLDFI